MQQAQPDQAGIQWQEFGWGSPAPLTEWLAAEPQRFEFVQLLRLLEASQPEAIRLRARGGFAFPPSEVARLRRAASGEMSEMTVALLALDGAFGPLPSAYAEERLSAERTQGPAPGEFLDIFHNRLLRMLYCIAQVHRPALGEGRRNQLGEILLAIAGMGMADLRNRSPLPDLALPRYAALLGRDTRSAHGLEAAVADFSGHAVTVRQFQGAWSRLEAGQRTGLGQGGEACRLGGGAVLGGRVWDDSAGIEIGLGDASRPLTQRGWTDLLPGGGRHAAIVELVRLYVRDEFGFRMRLTIAPGVTPRSWLGGARLGYTSFLAACPPARVREVQCRGSAR